MADRTTPSPIAPVSASSRVWVEFGRLFRVGVAGSDVVQLGNPVVSEKHRNVAPRTRQSSLGAFFAAVCVRLFFALMGGSVGA